MSFIRPTMPATHSKQRRVLEALARAFDQESSVLREIPELAFPQVFSQLKGQTQRNDFLRDKLDLERKRFKKPWFFLLTKHAKSDALIRAYPGHSWGVSACAFSPDGRRMVSASYDETLRLWDVERGRLISILIGHLGIVDTCAFSPDGRRIISARTDHTLMLWDTETGQKIYSLIGHSSWVKSCAFSPDGPHVVSGSWDGTLRLWEVESGRQLSILKGHTDAVNVCAFSPEGRRIVLGDKQGLVLLLSPQNIAISDPVVTPVRILMLGGEKEEYRWVDALTSACRWCGKRFAVKPHFPDIVKAMSRDAGLTAEKSSRVGILSGARDDPRRLSECPHCHKPLRINPSLVDNRDRPEFA